MVKLPRDLRRELVGSQLQINGLEPNAFYRRPGMGSIPGGHIILILVLKVQNT